jgi:hypothetical protein
MLDLPEPGGPVKSQAWDISCPESLGNE